MNKYLQQIVELSELDKALDAFDPKIKSINDMLQSKQDEIDELSKNDEILKNEIEELISQITKTNIHISEFNAKISDCKKKASSIKTEKESKALILEENLAKEQLSAANDEIVKLEKIIASKEEQIKEASKLKEEKLKDFNELQKNSNKELDEINEKKSKVFTQKEKLMAKIDQKMLVFYEKIRRWAKNSVVVPVRKQACYGCFMKINDKTYSAVIRSDDIVTCPHCGRILYKEIDKE